MENKKNFIIAGVIGLILLVIGSFFFWQEWKKDEVYRVAQKERQELLAKNPTLKENLEKAILENKKTLNSSPNNFSALSELGSNYHSYGDFKNAEITYKKALEVESNTILVWNNLAKLYFDLGKNEEAKQAYLEIIERFPDEFSAYYDLANMFISNKAGNIEDAKYLLQQGILKTNNQGLKDALERLNKEGRI